MIARTLVLALMVGCGGPRTGLENGPPNTLNPVTTRPAEDTTGVPADSPDKIGLALTITPPDAMVTIDDTTLGAASELDPVITLAVGLHTLVVTKPGFKAYRAEFSVTDRTETFTVKLERAK